MDFLYDWSDYDGKKQAEKKHLKEIGAETFDFFTVTAPQNGYKIRDGQLELACEITDALIGNQHYMAEAGVGIGKSFAYIVPVLSYIRRFNRPAVISTSTIALQEQLKDDIENVMRMIGHRREVLIAKGQTHFLCRRRREGFLAKTKSNSEVYKAIAEDKDERSDWNISIPDYIWDRIKVVKYNRKRCSRECSFRRECKYHKLRSMLLDTKGVIICNHDLLTVDLRRRDGYSYEILSREKGIIIVDEAHNLERVVRTALTDQVTQKDVDVLLETVLSSGIDHPDVEGIIVGARKLCHNVYNEVFNQLIKQDQIAESKGYDIERYYVHLPRSIKKLKEHLNKLTDILDVAEGFSHSDYYDSSDYIYEELMEFISFFTSMMEGKDGENIFWAEKSGDSIQDVILLRCPKSMAKEIRACFFGSAIPIVLTSATLTSNHSYDYIVDSIGFDKDNDMLGEEKLSPFCYDKNAMIYYSADLPNPKYEREKYLEEGTRLVKELITITHGKTLILFTSKTDMELVYHKLVELNLPYELMIQKGNVKQKETLDKFRSNTNSVLLGTGSYWEGINIVGESLSQVIIFRLPFPTPEPIIDYKTKLTPTGFDDVVVPEMILKLKQGVGRLIRSENDKGIVSIIDSRVGDNVDTNYKNKIWNSLPIKNRTNDLSVIRQFYESVCTEASDLND